MFNLININIFIFIIIYTCFSLPKTLRLNSGGICFLFVVKKYNFFSLPPVKNSVQEAWFHHTYQVFYILNLIFQINRAFRKFYSVFKKFYQIDFVFRISETSNKTSNKNKAQTSNKVCALFLNTRKEHFWFNLWS